MKKLIVVLVISLVSGNVLKSQSNESPFKRHSVQFNIAGLAFERYGLAYELRITPHHALFVQGGGSFPVISEE